MDPRTFRLFAAALVLIVLMTGTAALLAGGTASDPEAPDGEQVVGVVVAVDSAGLDQVAGFTVRDDAGRLIEFVLGRLENGAEFPPGHLTEHMTTADPVRVWYREVDGERVAFRLEDAE
jgi:hypothetical protein